MSEIIVYNNIVRNVHLINAWANSDCLPVSKMADPSILDNIGVVEVTFGGTHGDNTKYEELVNNSHMFLERYLYSQKLSIFRYEVDSVKLKSKIRSYKGMFPKIIDKSYVIQEEFDVDEHYSIMAGLIKITTHNNLIFPLYFNENQCLILSNENNLFSKQTLEYITTKLINQSSFVIDYISMCIHYCKNGNIIIRETGDGGDKELSWQFFVEKDIINKLLPTLGVASPG